MNQPQDLRAWHQRRERAISRMHYATVAAYLGGAFAFVLFAIIGFDTGDWPAVAIYLAGSIMTVVLGFAVAKWRSQLATGALFINSVATLLLRILETHTPGPLIGLVFIYVYFQGFRAAMDYAEMENRIRNSVAPT
jgi:hypothetical protein